MKSPLKGLRQSIAAGFKKKNPLDDAFEDEDNDDQGISHTETIEEKESGEIESSDEIDKSPSTGIKAKKKDSKSQVASPFQAVRRLSAGILGGKKGMPLDSDEDL